MKRIHGFLLLFAAAAGCIMIPLFMRAQEANINDAHILPSGFAVKLERTGGYLGTRSVFWIYPDGQVINALGETGKIPPDIVAQWLKTIMPAPAARRSPDVLKEFPTMGSVCFDCSFYQITIYDKDGIRAFHGSSDEVTKIFPGIIKQLQHLAWLPLMGEPVETQEELLQLQRRRQPIKVGGNLLRARLIRRVEPVYPEQAKSAQLSGNVVLQVTVDEEGAPSAVEVVSGLPLLAESAAAAVRQWRFSPTILNGEPVPVSGTVTLTFSLTEAGGTVEY
jgi:TonB family protein